MSLEISLKGKRVLVTGAGNGIGLALCKKLYAQGAILYALDMNSASLEELVASCPGTVPICVNLTDWDATRHALKNNIKEPLDCLVNNAGLGASANFLKTQESDLETVIGVNLRGMFNVSQVIAEGMKKNGSGCGGSIVNISSLASRFPTRASLPYNLSKAGVDMLTKSMAFEWGPPPNSIRVNSINPNIIMTALAKQWMAAGEGAKLKDKLIGRTPLGRIGEVEDVVNAIIFLLSPSTAPMIHGAHLFVDGGFSAA